MLGKRTMLHGIDAVVRRLWHRVFTTRALFGLRLVAISVRRWKDGATVARNSRRWLSEALRTWDGIARAARVRRRCGHLLAMRHARIQGSMVLGAWAIMTAGRAWRARVACSAGAAEWEGVGGSDGRRGVHFQASLQSSKAGAFLQQDLPPSMSDLPCTFAKTTDAGVGTGSLGDATRFTPPLPPPRLTSAAAKLKGASATEPVLPMSDFAWSDHAADAVDRGHTQASDSDGDSEDEGAACQSMLKRLNLGLVRRLGAARRGTESAVRARRMTGGGGVSSSGSSSGTASDSDAMDRTLNGLL